MKLRLAAPEYLIDIDPPRRRARLHPRARRRGPHRRHDAPPRAARVGAPRRRLAIFTDAERVIADPVVRNRGTIGGALCQADPSEDLSAVCAAVGAQMVDPRSRRRARARHARVPPRPVPDGGRRRRRCSSRSACPLRERLGQRVREGRPPRRRLGRRRRRRVRRRSTAGRIARAGIALAAVGAEITSAEAEEALAGRPPSDELFAHAAALAAAACDPVDDQRGSAEYKRHVAGVLTERVLRRATARALGADA